MTRPSLGERIALRLARVIAGPGRRRWLDAMEAELDHLPARRLDWALGSLVAAMKDRLARERLTLALFAVLPACAAASVLPVTALAELLFQKAGLSMDLLGPVLFPAPFACAVLLGAARPWRRPLAAGALGFAVYQAVPSTVMYFAWGGSFGFWAPNLRQYGIHPGISVAGTLALWCAGVWLGARWARARKRKLNPPSP